MHMRGPPGKKGAGVFFIGVCPVPVPICFIFSFVSSSRRLRLRQTKNHAESRGFGVVRGNGIRGLHGVGATSDDYHIPLGARLEELNCIHYNQSMNFLSRRSSALCRLTVTRVGSSSFVSAAYPLSF
jgi:hypothetical protein